MAYTATLIKHSIQGNVRAVHFNVTADAASGSVATPLSFIDSIDVAPISMATIGGKYRINTNGTSSVSNGVLFISSIANGDNFFLTVYGRS